MTIPFWRWLTFDNLNCLGMMINFKAFLYDVSSLSTYAMEGSGIKSSSILIQSISSSCWIAWYIIERSMLLVYVVSGYDCFRVGFCHIGLAYKHAICAFSRLINCFLHINLVAICNFKSFNVLNNCIGITWTLAF